MNIVSDIAFGARNPKAGSDDGKPSLDEVLTELEVSERESDDLYMPSLETVETAPPQTAPAPAPAPAPAAKEPVKTTPAPAPAPAASAPPVPDDETQLRAQGHRRRLEKLLSDARHIEEMLAKEAAEATALAEKVNLEQKRVAAAHAAQNERQAITHSDELAKRRDTAIEQHTQMVAEVREAKETVDAAAALVADLQTKLVEAQKIVVQTKSKLREAETRVEPALTAADQAKVEARNAERRAVKCREAREAAEAEVAEAEEIASSIALTSATLERMRALGTNSSK